MAARTAGIDKMKKLCHCQSMYITAALPMTLVHDAINSSNKLSYIKAWVIILLCETAINH